MRILPVKNLIMNYSKPKFSEYKSRVSFSALLEDDSFERQEDLNFENQYIDEYVNRPLKNNNKSKKENTFLNYNDIINFLKNGNKVNSLWIKNHQELLKDVYGVDLFESEDLAEYQVFADEVNHNRANIINKIEEEYQRKKKDFYQSKFPENVDFNNENLIRLNFLQAKNNRNEFIELPSLYINSGSRLSENVISAKTNCRVINIQSSLGDENFLRWLEEMNAECKSYYSSTKKRTIIVADDLYRYLADNNENIEGFIEFLNKNKKDPKASLFFLINNQLPEEGKVKKDSFLDIPVYDDVKNILISECVQNYIPKGFIINGNEDDARELLKAFANDANIKYVEITSKSAIDDFSKIFFSLTDESDKNDEDNKKIIFIPSAYRYFAFSDKNKQVINEYINNLFSGKNDLVFLNSKYSDKISKTFNSGNWNEIELGRLSSEELESIFLYNLKKAAIDVDNKITTGEELKELKVDFDVAQMVKMLASKRDFGMHSIENLIEKSKNKYIKNPNKSFESYLLDDLLDIGGI